MIFYLIGISHKTAPLFIREFACRKQKEITAFWQSLCKEAAVLFTCNRAELYGLSFDAFSARRSCQLLQDRFPEIFKDSYLKLNSIDTVRHALRLACGLESQLLGEPQIIEQLSSWIAKDSFPEALGNLWKNILLQASTIRAKTGLNEYKTDISSLVLQDIERQLKDRYKQVVVIGTGKIAQLFAREPREGINFYFVSRKKHSRARQLARSVKGRAVLLENLPSLLLSADVLISATASPHYLVERYHLSEVINKRDKVLYIYDLAVPRDIEPAVGSLRGIILQNLDDLGTLFKEHNQILDHLVEKTSFFIEEVIKDVKETVGVYASKNRYSPKFTCVAAG